MRLKLWITAMLAVITSGVNAQFAIDSAATVVAGTDSAIIYSQRDTADALRGVDSTMSARSNHSGMDAAGPVAYPVQKVSLEDADTTLKPKWYKRKIVKSAIFPLALIGYSLTTFQDNGLYSNYDAKRDILKASGGFNSSVDNLLIWAPYAEIGVLNAFKIKCKTDLLNTSLLILKSELIMAAMVFPLKYAVKEMRPDSSNTQSFPSGHTAEAFVAASVVHKEYRHLSPWYGVGAYAVATSVAVFRMVNNKHWQSDVLAGAGIGLLSTHIAYATHQYRWGRKDVCFIPTIGNGMRGGMIVLNF